MKNLITLFQFHIHVKIKTYYLAQVVPLKSFDFLENDFIVQYGDTILDFDYKKFLIFILKIKKI